MQRESRGILLLGANLCLAQPSALIAETLPHRTGTLLGARDGLCTAQQTEGGIQLTAKPSSALHAVVITH